MYKRGVDELVLLQQQVRGYEYRRQACDGTVHDFYGCKRNHKAYEANCQTFHVDEGELQDEPKHGKERRRNQHQSFVFFYPLGRSQVGDEVHDQGEASQAAVEYADEDRVIVLQGQLVIERVGDVQRQNQYEGVLHKLAHESQKYQDDV